MGQFDRTIYGFCVNLVGVDIVRRYIWSEMDQMYLDRTGNFSLSELHNGVRETHIGILEFSFKTKKEAEAARSYIMEYRKHLIGRM